jgi:hypothetical protein
LGNDKSQNLFFSAGKSSLNPGVLTSSTLIGTAGALSLFKFTPFSYPLTKKQNKFTVVPLLLFQMIQSSAFTKPS